MRFYTLSEMKDSCIGLPGEADRDAYQYDLDIEILGRLIRGARLQRSLMQEELGRRVGVGKAQISKLESSPNSAAMDIIRKVHKALNAETRFSVLLENQRLSIG